MPDPRRVSFVLDSRSLVTREQLEARGMRLHEIRLSRPEGPPATLLIPTDALPQYCGLGREEAPHA